MATVVTLAALSACSKGGAKGEKAVASAPPSLAALQAAAAAAPAIPHGLRKELNLDVPVFVDGKEVAVLRYGELPPGVPATTNPRDDDHRVAFYRLWDYLKAIGVEPARVKAVHFADKGFRIGALEGSELRADEDRFVFDFLDEKAGLAKPAWITKGLKTKLRIDGFYGVNVFVNTTPWAIDPAHHCYWEDDDCKPVVRFTEGDLMKGTRVYDDGKLVGYVKRRLVGEDAVAGRNEAGETLFSIDHFLASLHVDTSHAKRIELFAGDDLVAEATASEWAADQDKLTFYLVQHAHGRVRANVPADLQIQEDGRRDRDVQITSIQVFERKEPRALPLVSIDEVIDPGPNAAAMENALAQSTRGERAGQ
jgi:hypothetical protein